MSALLVSDKQCREEREIALKFTFFVIQLTARKNDIHSDSSKAYPTSQHRDLLRPNFEKDLTTKFSAAEAGGRTQ